MKEKVFYCANCGKISFIDETDIISCSNCGRMDSMSETNLSEMEKIRKVRRTRYNIAVEDYREAKKEFEKARDKFSSVNQAIQTILKLEE